MGTLASELEPHAGRIAAQPRMYVDANVPSGAVTFMRGVLKWDVLHVIEEADLRRASDLEHFRLARQLGRTLITLDRDYLDATRFPPAEGGGVLVVTAPDDIRLKALLKRFHAFIQVEQGHERPLEGRTLHIHVDWEGA
jgi:Domain of unknown function (DUF5615)